METGGLPEIDPIVAAAGGLIGLVLCFAGFWLLQAFARLESALLLGLAGLVIPSMLTGVLWIGIAGLVAGLVVGFILGPWMLRMGIAIQGAGGGFALGAIVGRLSGVPELLPALVGALLFAVLGYVMARPILIFLTGLLGGFTASGGACVNLAHAGILPRDSIAVLFLVAATALSVAGIFVQVNITRGKADPIRRGRPAGLDKNT